MSEEKEVTNEIKAADSKQMMARKSRSEVTGRMDDGEENRPANGPDRLEFGIKGIPANGSETSNGHGDSKDIVETNGHTPIEEEIQPEDEETPEIDIHISNVVCDFGTRCHLNLRQIANQGSNVIYKREQGAVFMKIRKPRATASIRSSGRITITGPTSEPDAKKSARRISRILQKMGFNVRMTDYRVVNVLGNVTLPFGIKLGPFTQNYPKICSYEPEIHPGATYKYKDIKATYTLFQTGSITLTAPNVAAIDAAVQHIYPLVYEFRKDKSKEAILAAQMKGIKRQRQEKSSHKKPTKKRRRDHREVDEDESESDGSEEEDRRFINDDDDDGESLTSEDEASFTDDEDD